MRTSYPTLALRATLLPNLFLTANRPEMISCISGSCFVLAKESIAQYIDPILHAVVASKSR